MRIDFWHNWKLDDGALMSALIGAVLFGIGATIGSTILARMTAPPWFHADVIVPDHTEGSNPVIEYTVKLRENLIGDWYTFVEVKTENGWTTVCRTHEPVRDTYTLDEDRSDRILTLQQYLAEPCQEMIAGHTYRVQTVWDMAIYNEYGASEVRRYLDKSNEFDVM